MRQRAEDEPRINRDMSRCGASRGGPARGERRRREGGPAAALAAFGALTLLLPACDSDSPVSFAYAPLAPLSQALAEHGTPFEALVVGDGLVPPRVSVVAGRLPSGLRLDGGRLVGQPLEAGEYQRFVLEAYGAGDEVLGRRAYVVGVGVPGTNLADAPEPLRDADRVVFAEDWGGALDSAFVWDEALGLLWPLRVGRGAEGVVLAPGAGLLSFVVAGRASGLRGRFDLEQPPLDERVRAVAQLSWSGDADIDLRLVPETADLGLTELSASTPEWEMSPGVWGARLAVSSDQAPAAEALVISSDLVPGRYALVAVKAAGASVSVPLWLSVRERDGDESADVHVEALLSDAAQGAVDEERASGRQSFRALGTLVVGDGGALRYQPPAASGALFAAPEAP